MDRVIVYPAAIPQDTDVLSSYKNSMLAVGALMKNLLGTTPVADGLLGTQTTVASLTINIGPGTLTALSNVDTAAYGSLGSDTTDTIMKMGINLLTTQLTMTAPTTTGQSVNYLIQAEFVEADGTPIVLPYYNPTAPASPYSGPSNTGVSQNTIRTQRVALQALPGTPATTGSQTTPAVTAGWVPLYVVTVAYGQTAITTAQIIQAPGAPFVDPLAVGRGIQPGRLLNIQPFAASGTYTPTLGANFALVKLWGASGGSCGAQATAAGQFSGGAGGGGGAYVESKVAVSASVPVAITIGLGGAAGLSTGATAGNGGQSKFGITLIAPGGGGGTASGVASSFPSFSSYGPGAAAGSGGNIVNQQGGFATGWQAQTATNFLGGAGGASGSGAPGANPNANVTAAGPAGASPGCGPAGATNLPSASAQSGTVGTNGLCLIFEYS